eukprot:304968-Pleurochrysis_carterae.AAC.1
MPAPIPPSASRIAGSTHIGACAANCGHHARPFGSPQSAGFSRAHGVLELCAAITSSIANAAS